VAENYAAIENDCDINRSETHDLTEKNVIWDSSWLPENIQKIIKENSIIDQNELKEMPPIIRQDETDVFDEYY
jgi:hypothetical protein